MQSKHMNRIILLSILYLSTSLMIPGCASDFSTRTYTSYYIADEIVKYPELNMELEAEVGQRMISSLKNAVYPAIKLNKEIIHSGKNNGYGYSIKIPASILLEKGYNNEGVFYKAEEKISFLGSDIDSINIIKVEGGIYLPNDVSKPPEIFWLDTNKTITIPLNDKESKLEYQKTTYTKLNKDSFKRELVYTGLSQNTILLLYREFSDNYSMPTFSQNLKYDLFQGNVIVYAGARFEVIKATNTSIRYKVLKSLD